MTKQQQPQLKAAATEYYEQGLNVVPEKLTYDPAKGKWDKMPLVPWRDWDNRRQTIEEFRAIDWTKANAFAVVLGQQTNDGLFLAVIDYDVKGEVPEDVKAKGKELLKQFPITQTEKTVSDGLHLIYYSKQKPKTEATFHDSAALELLGEHKLCLMAPSKGYARQNDNSPTTIESLENTFYSVLAKNGFKKEEEAADHQDSYTFEITKLLDISKLTKIGPDEYQGRHPVHDSTTEKNFTVNTRVNTWYCFRHSSGGGALQFLAVKEGLIKCEQSKRGALRGKKFKEVINLAIAQKLIKREDTNLEENESQADRLINLCLAENAVLFYDQHKTAYIRISEPLRYCDINGVSETLLPLSKNNDVKKERTQEPDKVSEIAEIPQIPQVRTRNLNIPLRGKQFKAWLANLMWKHEQKAPGTEALNCAINVLMGKALSEGKEYTLYNRVAPAEDGIWLDMTDERWRAIKITPEGWAIIDDPPILFKRYNHQQPLIDPIIVPEEEAANNALRLLEYINIPKDDDKTKLSFICTCISYLIPLIPHPILVVHGPQGSAKTWLFRLVRRTIDPSSIEVLSLPRDDRELVQQLDHHWLAFYDNLTSLPAWASDMYCRAATGMGFSKRELYSDDDDTIYNFKRCIGLNGINPAARRADLLDRSMLVPTAKITNGERKTEEIINSEFENAKAAILGGFLSILVKALKLYPSIKPDGLFRMADFARYGCAIAQVLGKTSDDFIKAYEQKVESQNEEAINASPVASTILDLCQIHFAKEDGKTVIDTWENTPTELYQLATNHAQKLGIRTDNRGSWPKAPNAFTRILNDITPSLFGVGYEITIKEGFPRKVIITTGKQASLFPSSKGRYCKNDIEVTDSEKSTIGEKPEPEAKDKPTFCVRKTPQAEKCDCGNFAVEYEIITPQHDMLKRCENCFNNLRVQFAAAVWKQGYPDLPNFEEKSEEAP